VDLSRLQGAEGRVVALRKSFPTISLKSAEKISAKLSAIGDKVTKEVLERAILESHRENGKKTKPAELKIRRPMPPPTRRHKDLQKEHSRKQCRGRIIEEMMILRDKCADLCERVMELESAIKDVALYAKNRKADEG